MAPITRSQVYQGAITRSRSKAKHPRAAPPTAYQRRQAGRRQAQARRRHRRQPRPAPLPAAPQAARPAAGRVVVAIDNRDALINIYRQQIQTLELELRRSRARVEAAMEHGRQEIRAKMFG